MLTSAFLLLIRRFLGIRAGSKREIQVQAGKEAASRSESISGSATVSPVSTRSRKKKAKAQAEEDELNHLPVIPQGVRCWRRRENELVEVVKVYYDDLPPYYTIRLGDGSERSTIRARLQTIEERAAADADAKRQAQDARAAAAAAELLAEEEREAAVARRRRPSSSSKPKKR